MHAWSVALLLLLLGACHAPRTNVFTDPAAGDDVKAGIARDSTGDVATIHRLWEKYSYNRWPYDCEPNPRWISVEQGTMKTQTGAEMRSCFDVASTMIDPQSSPKVIAIDRVKGVDPPEYRLTIRYDMSRARAVSPYSAPTAIITHFAVKENGEWKLASALGRLTRDWKREVVGPFTYIVSPRVRFSPARAEAAVRFADSLAVAFGLRPLEPTRYFLVRDADEMLRIMGYQTDTVWGTPAGRTFDDFIISGDSVFGEKHGHEIAHKVLSPLYGHANLTIVASEGVASWLGGTRGMHFSRTTQVLRNYLRSNPAASLDSILSSNAHPMYNPAAALLTSIVHTKAGVAGIARYLKVGPDLPSFRKGVASITGLSWNELAAEWKRLALSAAD